MTFARQYERALTIRPASPQEPAPLPQYFAGSFYELLESTAAQLPTVLSGGSVEIISDLTLSYQPLPCRMLLYTQQGSGRLQIRGQKHTLETGTLLYLDCSDTPFTLSPDCFPWYFITFSFGGGLFSVYESLVPFKTFTLKSLDGHSSVLRSIRQLLAGNGDAVLQNKLNDASLITAILTEFFIDAYHLEATETKCAPYLKEIRHFLDNYFMEPFRLDDLEKRYHMSKYRICREFSDTFGTPPLRYLNKKRLETSVNLLFTTDKKIHEIALEVGYENTNHFINLFKKEYGATPQAYREAHLH